MYNKLYFIIYFSSLQWSEIKRCGFRYNCMNFNTQIDFRSGEDIKSKVPNGKIKAINYGKKYALIFHQNLQTNNEYGLVKIAHY